MTTTTTSITIITSFGNLLIAQFPCLSSNYGFLVHDKRTGQTAAIDTPDAKSYRTELTKQGWTLTHILNTHHHWDHTGGNIELLKSSNEEGQKNIVVYGPVMEETKIPGITNPLGAGEEIVLFGSSDKAVSETKSETTLETESKVTSESNCSFCRVQILDVGGHTAGHIAYYFPDEQIVFVGDSLFALGCGRMFEGTADQFWSSMKTLRSLPDETTVFCAHEYTKSNAEFAASIEPGNVELMERVEIIQKARERGEYTIPTNLGVEKRTNPFLRCDCSIEIRTNVGAVDTDTDSDVFAKVRIAKDNYKSNPLDWLFLRLVQMYYTFNRCS